MDELVGSKSFLSMDRGANFICRKNGKEYNYYAYQGAEFCEYDLIHEIDTVEPDGVIFEMAIKDFWEKGQFITKAKQKLAYYDTVALIIDYQLVESTIWRYNDFQWSTLDSSSKMHICLKDVYYPLDFTKLGIDEIYTPVALRFGLKDGLIVTPSRENIIYTENVKKIIKDKIVKVSDYLVSEYNKTVVQFEDFLSAYPYVNVEAVNVTLNDKIFKINSLTKYSSYPLTPISVKGIKFKSPSFYKSNQDIFSSLLNPVAKYSTGYGAKYTTKNVYLGAKHILGNRPNIVLVSDTPKGNVKTFLKDKYDTGDTYFVKLDMEKSAYWLKNALYLSKHPFSQWRNVINEFFEVAKSLEILITDERDVTSSQEFLDFLQDKKDRKVKSSGSSNYQGLNKQKGDITISYESGKGSVVFKKKAFPINKLHKNEFLTIYFSPDDIDIAKKYFELLDNAGMKVALIGKREITKLPDIHNFKTLEQFMSRDTKPFMRIASAILFSKILEEFDTISEGNVEIFENCLTSYAEDYKKLKEYVDKNYQGADVEIEQAILAAAESKDLFDKRLWDIYIHLKEGTSKFGFVTCFKSPDSFDDDEIKKYTRTINQLLLFHKLHSNLLDGYEIAKSPQPELKEEIEDDTDFLEEVFLDKDTSPELLEELETV